MRTRVIFLSGLLALAYAGGAAAQDNLSPWYIGIGAGKARAKFQPSDFSFNSAAVSEGKDERDTAYKFMGGYRLSRNIALELSYTTFGKFVYQYQNAAGQSSVVNYKASAWALSGVGMLPLSGSFSLLARLGLDYSRAERSSLNGTFTTAGPYPSADRRRAGVIWGAGAQYDFSDKVGLRLEYEDYGKFGKANPALSLASPPSETGQVKMSLLSLSLIGRF